MHTWLQSEDADAAVVRSWLLDSTSLDLHLEIVRKLHQWRRREIPASDAVDSIMNGVDKKPRRHMLNTATALYRRFRSEVQEFADILERLSLSRHALVRVYAAFEMRDEPFEDRDRVRFERLLGDKSKAVRREIVQVALMRRWYVAVLQLQIRRDVETDEEIKQMIDRAIRMIPRGFDLRDGWADVYLGPKPGGVGAVGGASLKDVSISFLEEFGKKELAYRLKHERWPERPSRYYRFEELKEWDVS